MYGRNSSLHGAQHIAVVEPRQVARESSLNADLSGAPRSCFTSFVANFFRSEEVGRLVARTDAEGAKLATHETDIGEVNIARNDEADDSANKTAADLIGGNGEAE